MGKGQASVQGPGASFQGRTRVRGNSGTGSRALLSLQVLSNDIHRILLWGSYPS